MKCDFYSNEPLWTFYDPNIEIRYDLGLVDRVSAGFTLGHVDKYFSDTSETGVGYVEDLNQYKSLQTFPVAILLLRIES